VPSRRADALGRRSLLVVVAAPIAVAGVIGAVALAAPAIAAGPNTPLPFPTVCGSTSTSASASASATPSTKGSSPGAITKKNPGTTPSPSASSPGASASPSASSSDTTGAANAPNGSAPSTPAPSPSASSPSSSGGFWGWLNGVWTWIFGSVQLPKAPAAPVLAAANTNSGSNAGAASVQTTSSKPVVPPKITTNTKAPALAVPSPTTPTSTGSPSCVPSSSVKRAAVAAAAGNVAAQTPWHLSTPSMTQYNLTYNGITTIQTVGGGSLQVLDFTASKVTLVSMVTFSQQGGGKLQYVDGGPNQTVTLNNVHLWTTELKANLLGLIPVDYTPSSPPPLIPGLTIPIPLLFTSVEADNAFLSTQSIVIPGFNGHGN
jgi:hypothetical protein